MSIHPTAIIDETAQIGADVHIGPYAYIGPQVVLDDGVRVDHAATVEGPTHIGAQTHIFPHAAVGLAPQDLKYAGEQTRLHIGARCRIREFASLHRGTKGGGLTQLGDDVLIMNGAHVGHDCQVGNGCIVAANSALGGHVVLGDQAIIGGVSGIHQFVRIGAHAMVSAGILVTQDVPTYAVVRGGQETLSGVNITGLKRRGFSRDAIRAIQTAMDMLFPVNGDCDGVADRLADRLAAVQAELGDRPSVQPLIDFMGGSGANNRQRGFVQRP